MSDCDLSTNAELHLLLCMADHAYQLLPAPLPGYRYVYKHEQSQKERKEEKKILSLWHFKEKKRDF